MFVRCRRRFKDGKAHRHRSVVKSVGVRGGQVSRFNNRFGDFGLNQGRAGLEGPAREQNRVRRTRSRAPTFGCDCVGRLPPPAVPARRNEYEH